MAEDKLTLDGIFQKGYGVIPRLVMQDNRLDIGAKGFYAYLCSYTGTGNSCYPSREKICHDLNIGKDTLGKYSAQLMNAGYLRIDKVRENGRFLHNLYVIQTASPSPCPDLSDTEKPCPDFPDTINNNHINNSIINNKDIRESHTLAGCWQEQADKPKTQGTKTSPRFIPPTLEEVAAYCRERRSIVSAESFFDFYSANGWVQGKGKPIRDWRAAVRTWERRDRENGKRFIPPENKPEDEVILPF